MNFHKCEGECLIKYLQLHDISVWWNCHDMIRMRSHPDMNIIKEIPCAAMTVPQATKFAEHKIAEDIIQPLNIFEMIELEREISELNLFD